ncbi:Hypothetical predicted protein, partial [Pelobates cultripes]
MSLLPKLQYLFRSLQIPIPRHYMTKLQKIITRFTWANKTPRVALSTIKKPIEKGGMGFPDIKLYYKAALLSTVAVAHRADNPPQWVAIETHESCRAGMHHLFWVPKHLRPAPPQMLETTKLLLHTWDTSRAHLSVTGDLSLASTMYSIYLRNPTFDFRAWTKAGCTHIHDLYTGSSLKQFPDIQAQYKIPNRAIFSYLQIKSMLQHHTPSPGTPAMSDYEACCLKGTPHKRTFSRVYGTLLTGTHNSTDNFKQ